MGQWVNPYTADYLAIGSKWRTEVSNQRAAIPIRENEILRHGRKTNEKVFVTEVRNI